jgi:hypothetical protein
VEIQHLTLTAERETRLPLFRDERGYLQALWRIGAVCRGCLALFALLAEHLHLVAALSRAAAGRLAQSVLVTLKPVVATPLAASHIRSVESRSHMRWLLRYLLEQPKEHGMQGHPALWVGSCYPELCGARRVDGLSLRIEEVLPDYSSAAASRLVGLPGTRLVPADRDALRRAGAHRIAAAAAASFGVDASLAGKERVTLLARRAAAQLAERVGIRLSDVADSLQLCARSAWRLRHPPAEPALLVTIARRVALEDLVRSAAQPAYTPAALARPRPAAPATICEG